SYFFSLLSFYYVSLVPSRITHVFSFTPASSPYSYSLSLHDALPIYNSSVLRHFQKTIEEKHQSTDEYTVIAVGRIGYDYCRNRDIPVSQSILGVSDHPTFADIKELASQAVQMYIDGAIDELNIFYNHYESVLSQVPT